jgi:primosomal protein N' (replication factor Y)
MVGPRSALFTPFTRLGLIVVDECHDDSYYQSGNSPAYSARTAAVQYAELTQAVCLLGSATPDLDSRYKAERREWHYLSLPGRILAHRLAVRKQMERLSKDSATAPLPSRYQPFDQEAEMTALPPVHIVDLRQELKAGNRSIFSRLLHDAMTETLQHGQQAILYMNRRGAATFVFCRECGFTLKCPNCDIPLTYHIKATDRPALHCHHCSYSRQMPTRCPNCRSEQIRHLGTGTERIEVELQAAFPGVRTLRWDQDTTRQKGSHELMLTHFSNHQADVLVGTQMIAKGLDLPLVTLVGVILADAGLNLPDLRAAERTFQLLTQVAGRAGRSPLGGQVVLQTFQPEHYVIQAAAQHDYPSFFAQELQRRKELDYPPFTNLVRLEFRHRDPIKARQTAVELAQSLNSWIETEQRSQTSLIGPAPCFLERLAGMYRWQIILRGPDPASLLRTHPIPREWTIEVNPPSLL